MKEKCNTPISYYGGKQTMLKNILPMVPKHNLYCEPYAGGAALFFAKEQSKIEVINDLNNEVVNFYKVLKNKPTILTKSINNLIYSRTQYIHAKHIYNNSQFFSDIERATAFWFLSKICFSGELGGSFAFDKKRPSRAKKLTLAKNYINDFSKRIELATIECDNAITVIKRYDTIDTFFFLDPPYVGCNMGHYADMFNEQSLIELLDICTTIAGKFMLTMYPNEVIKQYAEDNEWIIHEVERRVTACKAQYQRKQIEWMVCNYIL